VLPDVLGRFTKTVATAIGCDPTYVVLPLLAGLAGAIGNSRAIRLKGGWIEPAVLWTVAVGESGTQKSPAFDAPLRPVRELQAAALKVHLDALKQHRSALALHDVASEAWRHQATSTPGDECEAPPDAPPEPVCERFVVGDTTIEALADRLRHAPRGLLLYRDELAGWVRSFDQYKGGRGGDVAHWLTLHGARDLMVDRKGGGTIYVPHAAVSITGGIQPEILRRVLAPEYREDGLAARLLMAMPPRRKKRWTDDEIPEELNAELVAVYTQLYKLRHDVDVSGNPVAVQLPFTPRAKQLWVAFYNQHAEEESNLTGDEAAAWSKLEGYAARLALVVQLVLDPGSRVVDANSVQAGIDMSRWFGHETRRIYAALAETEAERDRRRLIELVRRRGGRISVSDLQASDRRFRSDSSSAEQALDDLVKAGFGKWKRVPPGPRGGRPSHVFVLT
jgi:hypothetical protein